MSATASSRRNRFLTAAWAVFGLVNLVLMYVFPGRETIPFHFIWIGLSLVYGFTIWHPGAMVTVLCAVAVTTGYVMVHHAADGEIGWEEVTEVPLMSAVFGVMVWHVRRRQQALAALARLAETERRRADVQQLFVRLASHELRTPITVARGYAELVRDASADDGVRTDSAIVLDELDKLTRITQRLVTLMQLDTGYVREPACVDSSLARIVRRWEPTADRVWVVRSAIGQAAINHERLEAAIDCLLENAVKFTGPGDRVEVTGSSTADGWTVAVSDSGVGMTTADAAALTAADAPPRRTASGTGLGLAIARTVVTSWGGGLTVSGAPGAGTTVTLSFPKTHDTLVTTT
jgi:signal transduction histidine kinase